MPRTSYRVRFAGGNGFELAGIVDRPDDRESFPVAVFSHCFTCNKDLKAIVRISRALAEAGIGVLRYDMTGLGGSEGDFSNTNFTTNVADLRAAIQFAGTDLGRVTALIGHSFGGAASLSLAGLGDDAESRFSPLALITIAAPSDTHHLAHLLANRDPAIQRTGQGKVSIGGLTWNIRKEMLDDFLSHDLPAAIGQIKSPTLLFHSPVDQTLGFDHALRIMGLIQSSPNFETPVSLVSLERADHLLAENVADLEFVATTASAFLLRYAKPRP